MVDQEIRRLPRRCAEQVIELLKTCGSDRSGLENGLLAAVQPLLQTGQLTQIGAKRQGNFVNNSKYLYYDGQLEITLNQMPVGRQFPAHDHGTLEALIMYSGRLRHTVFERTDDGGKPGYAELRVLDDRVLERGDIALTAPPVEIHSFKALTDDTFVLTIVDGQYKSNRHFYNPEARSYTVGTPAEQRASAASA